MHPNPPLKRRIAHDSCEFPPQWPIRLYLRTHGSAKHGQKMPPCRARLACTTSPTREPRSRVSRVLTRPSRLLFPHCGSLLTLLFINRRKRRPIRVYRRNRRLAHGQPLLCSYRHQRCSSRRTVAMKRSHCLQHRGLQPLWNADASTSRSLVQLCVSLRPLRAFPNIGPTQLS